MEELIERCMKCNKNITTEEYISNGGYCEKCINEIEEEYQEQDKTIRQQIIHESYPSRKNDESIILSTTNQIEGYNISKYVGIVSGTDIYLVGGVFGGGLVNQEALYSTALANAVNHLRSNAEAIGANAVIGIQNNIVSPGGLNNIIVVVTGTAVIIDEKS